MTSLSDAATPPAQMPGLFFRCVAAIPNGGGKCIEHFYEDNARGRRSAEDFARRYDKPGYGVYDCVSPLRESKRIKDGVALIEGLHVDNDTYKTGRDNDQVIKQLQDQFAHAGILSQLNTSGRGLQALFLFKEPLEPGPRAETAQRVLKRLTTHLGGDPQPAHFAALMRRLGTTNSKDGDCKVCKALIITGERCDLSDIEAYLDLAGEREAFPDDSGTAIDDTTGPIDIDARLAAMKYEDKEAGVNATLCAVIPSLIRQGFHPDDIFKQVFSSIELMAKRDNLLWDMEQKKRKRMTVFCLPITTYSKEHMTQPKAFRFGFRWSFMKRGHLHSPTISDHRCHATDMVGTFALMEIRPMNHNKQRRLANRTGQKHRLFCDHSSRSTAVHYRHENSSSVSTISAGPFPARWLLAALENPVW